MQTLAHFFMLYLEYSIAVLALGAAVACGLWFWLGLASFARSARDDR